MADSFDLLTPRALASELGITTRTLERMRVRGDGPTYTRVGGLIRYQRGDVRAYLEAQRAGSTSEADQRDRATAAA